MGKTLLSSLATVAVGGAMALAAAAPALADSHTTIDVKDDQVPTTAAGFGEQECDGPFRDLADDQDGWHFVLTQYDGDLGDLAMSFDFEDASSMPVSVDADPDEFDRPGASSTVHLWLVTDAGWTLVDAQATGPADGFGGNPQFNLSHTCVGESGGDKGQPSPSPSPTPTAPGENGGGGGGEDGDEDGDDEGGLPVTGIPVSGLVALGVGLLAAGVATLAVRRRRSLPGLTDG